MKCSCLSAGIDEFGKQLKSKIVKSRKNHICHECKNTINKGSEYLYEVMVFDGDLHTYKTCLDCKSIRGNLVCDFIYGDLWEPIEEIIRNDVDYFPWSLLQNLTTKARNKVLEMIEEQWEEEEF